MGVDPFDLPDDLLDDAAGRLAGAEGMDRDAILAQLTERNPRHASALQALNQALLDTDRIVRGALSPPAAREPEQIGAYRVLRRLGEGAFGVVYLCAQDQPVQRQVAVKVLRPGAGDQQTLARFANERQVLVGLDHQGIAAMIDAGEMPDGRPYFAMEYVDGEPITAACDRHRLSIDDRLRLFLELCGAVQHAHMRGVIHRDLKPGNVLVLDRDGRLQPKIIDFGIAKVLHRVAPAPGGATMTGRVVGTPGYMSPEQAAGRSHAIDTRTDVFSLGVMLYELLVGELPWREVESTDRPAPPRPSVRVKSDPARQTTVSTQRSTAPRLLAGKLRGDLDWIVLEALSNEPERRYQSAQALADDIERHLRHEVVTAGPPSTIYRLRKFAQRHRAAVVGAALVLVSLVVGSVVSFAYYRKAKSHAAVVELALARESDARGAAQVGFDSALGAVDALLTRVADLRLADTPQTEKLRQALFSDALRFYTALLRDHGTDPRLRREIVRVRQRVARLHLDLGNPEAAGREAHAAIVELEAMLGSGGEGEHDVRRQLAMACGLAGRAADGRDDDAVQSNFERAVHLLAEADDAANASMRIPLAHALLDLGSFFLSRGEQSKSLPVLRRARDLLTAVTASHSENADLQLRSVECDCFLHMALVESSPPAESDATFDRLRQSMAVLSQPAACSDDTLRRLVKCSFSLAVGRQKREQYFAARSTFDAAIVLQRRLVDRHSALPGERTLLARLLRGRGHVCGKLGDEDAAEAALREAIAIQQRLVDEFPDQPALRWDLSTSQTVCVNGMLQRGMPCALVDAEELARRALATLRALPDNAFPHHKPAVLAFALGSLGHVLDACGRDATSVWEETVATYVDYLQRWPDMAFEHDNFSRAAARLATRRLAAGDVDGAADLVQRVRADRAAHKAASVTAVSRRNFARILALEAEIAGRRGDPAAAAAAADEMEPWLGECTVRRQAADALFFAWQAARMRVDPLAAEYGERAEALYEATALELESNAGDGSEAQRNECALAWGQVDVRRAEILAERGQHAPAAALAGAGLDRLTLVRAHVHANAWSDQIYVAGHVTLARSCLALGDLDAAAGTAARLATKGDGDPDALIAAACLFGESAARRAGIGGQDAAEGPGVGRDVTAALAALRRAVASGANDRRRLDDPALALVRQHSEFAAIVDRLPPEASTPFRGR